VFCRVTPAEYESRRRNPNNQKFLINLDEARNPVGPMPPPAGPDLPPLGPLPMSPLAMQFAGGPHGAGGGAPQQAQQQWPPHVNHLFDGNLEAFRMALQIGDICDAQDRENSWYVGRVIDASEHDVRIHFDCWQNQYVHHRPVPSHRLCPSCPLMPLHACGVVVRCDVQVR
jgi:hypothetical protein